jgi:hypothetical protein
MAGKGNLALHYGSMSYISRQDAKEQRRKIGDQRFSLGIQWKKP